jgi:predicted phosphodiesterase
MYMSETVKISSRDWSPEEVSLLEQLRPHLTITEVFEEFRSKGYDRSRKAIERKACNIRVFYKGKPTDTSIITTDDEYSAAWQKILNLKQEYKEDYDYRRVGLMDPKKSNRKILCISDFHIPFDRDDLIYSIIKEHHDADILVVNGDMLDLHAVSTWPKERAVILRKEYDIAMEYLKVFSQTFPHVVITRGNHEYRLNRYFHSNVSKDVSFMINKEVLGRLAGGEIYDEDGNIIEKLEFKNVHYESGPEAWFCKIGKTMFVHPLAFSKIETKTAVTAQEYFMEREDLDCIVCAHTHHQGIAPSRNKLCIEQGCLCCPLDYEKQGKLRYKAMVLGYTVVYQDKDGNCDFNKTHNVYLGTQYPIKKSFDETMKKLNEES